MKSLGKLVLVLLGTGVDYPGPDHFKVLRHGAVHPLLGRYHLHARKAGEHRLQVCEIDQRTSSRFRHRLVLSNKGLAPGTLS